jgi:DNA modification methylase
VSLVLADARRLPIAAGSVQCCITSPPYWGLRDYGVNGQLGLEATPDAYVAGMVEVFRQVWRVLRDDGTLWLNVGDSYADDQLAGVPWRLAMALKTDGWRLISEVIWEKPKGSPSGGVRKPLRNHEQVFLLAKLAAYYYDADAIREPLAAATLARYAYPVKAVRSRASGEATTKLLTPNPKGRYRRSVWTVTPTSARHDGEHHAVMPEDLAEPCILAGSRPGDLVLDPFIGSGTVARCAISLGRRAVGCDLNRDYLRLADERAHITRGLPLGMGA